MFGTEVDQTLLISLGVIGAERVDAGLRRRLIEPDAWKQPPRRLNALCGCGSALVGHDLRLKAGSLQLAFVRHGMHFVVRGAIVWQHHQRVFVLVFAQPLDVSRERLPLRLVVVEHSDLAADKLRNPDYGIVGLCAGATDIPECLERQQRLSIAA